MGRETVWRLRNSEQPRQIPGGWRCVATILDRSLRETPDAEALVSRHARFTYRELDAAVASAACGLQALGVRTGDRVAACAGNHNIQTQHTEMERCCVGDHRHSLQAPGS